MALDPKWSEIQSQSEKWIPTTTQEQWAQIRTSFSSEGGRMLSQIVKRWCSLINELKRAGVKGGGWATSNHEIIFLILVEVF